MSGETGDEAMKVTVEIDCTPDEARRFLGLPDVAPMQDVVLAKLQERVLGAVDAVAPEALLKAWIPLAPEQVQQAMMAFLSAFGRAKG
jgi:hypothetical protein